jgi:ribonuclease HII
LGIEVVPVIDGDALIPMVGAASILAKVERDDYMKRIAKKYPKYGFEKHKGY